MSDTKPLTTLVPPKPQTSSSSISQPSPTPSSYGTKIVRESGIVKSSTKLVPPKR